MKRRRLRGRALLIASAGLASVTYIGCPKDPGPVGNLMAPPDTPEQRERDRKAAEEAYAEEKAARAAAEKAKAEEEAERKRELERLETEAEKRARAGD